MDWRSAKYLYGERRSMLFLNTNLTLIRPLCIVALWIVGSMSASSLGPRNSFGPEVGHLDQRAALAIQALQTWYDLDTGLYKTTGWWNSANVITLLADYSKVTQSREYDFVFSNTLSRAQKSSPGFINKYYDDEGWWALAWIDVCRITHDPRYLEVAKSVFADMTYGWDDTCSGGIWWNKSHPNTRMRLRMSYSLRLRRNLRMRRRNRGSETHILPGPDGSGVGFLIPA